MVLLLGWSGSTARLAVVPLHDIFVSQQFCWGDNINIMYPVSVGPFEVLKFPGNSGSRSTARAIIDLGAHSHNVDGMIMNFAILER